MQRNVIASGLALGTLVGVATSFGQAHLDGVGNALVNSVSAWLVAPYLAGALAGRSRTAPLAGLVACLAQVAAYYVTAELRGFPSTTYEIAFWSLCALPGGLVLGAAGGLRRPEALAASFLAEGAWTYAYRLHRPATAAVWMAIGLAILLHRIAPWPRPRRARPT